MVEIECGIDGKPALYNNPDNRAEQIKLLPIEKNCRLRELRVIDDDAEEMMIWKIMKMMNLVGYI